MLKNASDYNSFTEISYLARSNINAEYTNFLVLIM